MAVNLKRFYDATTAAEAKVQDLASQINDLFEKNQTEEALKLRPSLDAAKKDASDAHQLYLSMQAATTGDGDPATRFVPTGGDAEPKKVKDLRASDEYREQYWQAFKSGVSPKTILAGQHRADRYALLMDAMTETGGAPAGAEGGFLNPVDFDNRIIELMRQFVDMANYVNTEEVTAYTGWRAIEVAAAALPFAAMVENVDMVETEEPTFTTIPYTVHDFGGFIPISNDLLSDTPVNIMAYLARWMAKKVVLTNNSLILPIFNAVTPTVVADATTTHAAIKTALNLTLDPDVSAGASIFTNQAGFNVLDQLVDGDGRPLLQPDPTKATAKIFEQRPVIVLAQRLWANLAGPARTRIMVGDGRQLLTFFRRAAFEMAATTIGGAAWRRNNTEVRGIMRADVHAADVAAMVNLTVTLP